MDFEIPENCIIHPCVTCGSSIVSDGDHKQCHICATGIMECKPSPLTHIMHLENPLKFK